MEKVLNGKIQRPCQSCKKIANFKYPSAVRFVTRVESACHWCGVINTWTVNPPKRHTIVLTDFALATMLLLKQVFDKRFDRDLTLNETFGVLMAELEPNFRETAKTLGLTDK